MSALVERIIAARDFLKCVRAQYPEGDSFKLDAHEAVNALADAANAITERDETIHVLRHRLAKVEALSVMTDDEREGVAICFDCAGAGHDDDARTCERCAGNGEIVVDWAKYLGCTPEEAEMGEAAWQRHKAAGPPKP